MTVVWFGVRGFNHQLSGSWNGARTRKDLNKIRFSAGPHRKHDRKERKFVVCVWPPKIEHVRRSWKKSESIKHPTTCLDVWKLLNSLASSDSNRVWERSFWMDSVKWIFLREFSPRVTSSRTRKREKEGNKSEKSIYNCGKYFSSMKIVRAENSIETENWTPI